LDTPTIVTQYDKTIFGKIYKFSGRKLFPFHNP